MADRAGLHEQISAIAAELGGIVGVSARDLAGGGGVDVNADAPFPMASCFKVPVMVTVMRHVDEGTLSLEDRLTLREDDKSPGSTLIHCHAGLRPTVRDLLYLMVTLSDNTATDMLLRRVGMGAVNGTMRRLGLTTIDIRWPNREYFLMECGVGPEWHGLSGRETVAHWRALEASGDGAAAQARILEQNAGLSGSAFQLLYDECWGYDELSRYDDAFAIDQALDNQGSPADMAALLAMIAEGSCASAASCRWMLEIMSRQEWREKIPAGLPPRLLICNKTGGVAGTSNDAAIVFTPSGSALVIVVYCKGLSLAQSDRAAAAIAAVAGAVYDHLGERP